MKPLASIAFARIANPVRQFLNRMRMKLHGAGKRFASAGVGNPRWCGGCDPCRSPAVRRSYLATTSASSEGCLRGCPRCAKTTLMAAPDWAYKFGEPDRDSAAKEASADPDRFLAGTADAEPNGDSTNEVSNTEKPAIESTTTAEPSWLLNEYRRLDTVETAKTSSAIQPSLPGADHAFSRRPLRSRCAFSSHHQRQG